MFELGRIEDSILCSQAVHVLYAAWKDHTFISGENLYALTYALRPYTPYIPYTPYTPYIPHTELYGSDSAPQSIANNLQVLAVRGHLSVVLSTVDYLSSTGNGGRILIMSSNIYNIIIYIYI